MDRLEKLRHIKQAALYVEPQLMGSDFDRVRAAEEEWLSLVDQLYEGNGHIITERQYQAARTQFEYFMVLLEMTIAHHLREAREESEK